MPRYLDSINIPDAKHDLVLIGITDLGTPPMTGVIQGSNAALQAAAERAGQSTWDEATICTVHGLEQKPTASHPVPPKPEQGGSWVPVQPEPETA